jgi:hypothetical protein
VATVAEDAREQQLAWEARQRPRAGIAAIVGAILMIGGFLLWASLLRDTPRAGFLESLGHAAAAGPIGAQESVQAAGLQYYVDHTLGFIAAGIVQGLAPLALAWAVTFLAAATRARRREFPRPAVYVALIGAVLLGLGTAILPVDRVIAFNEFLDGPRTVDEARSLGGSLAITAELLSYIGQFMVAAGMLLVSLNAMRAGLLTRFLGILGVISGVLFVFPQLMPLPVVQSFWLVALGLVLLGVGRTQLPPAWKTGKAEPWPSAQEAAQRRREAEERRQGIRREPEPEPEPARERVPAARPHPSSKKRKRKRRGA